MAHLFFRSLRNSSGRLAGLIAGSLTLLASPNASASEQAVIVAGTMGDPALNAEIFELAQRASAALKLRGFDQITLVGDGTKVTKKQVLDALNQSESLTKEDQFWLVLIGHSAKSANGPAFQTSGPRLSAEELKTALDAIPAHQNIAILTGSSGGFIAPLLQENREIVSATKGDGQPDYPRFAEKWVAALEKDPKANLAILASTAVDAVAAECKSQSIVQAEEARFGNGATGKILAPPFPSELLAKAELPEAKQGPSKLPSAADIKIEIKDPNAEWEKHPADEQSLAILEEAKKTPNPGYPAVILDQKLQYATASDSTIDLTRAYRVYLTGAAGVEEWGTLMIPQAPPVVSTKLISTRLIFPDGSYSVFNPAKLPSGTVIGGCCPLLMKGATQGCIVEVAYRTRRTMDVTLPELSENETVQREIPAVHTVVEARLPDEPKYRAELKNSGTTPEETRAAGMKTLRWEVNNLAALEHLPGDPPMQRFASWLAVTSLPSWDAFANWFRHLAKDADASDESVVTAAKEIAGTASTREEKLRKTYEFVSSLRYIAIEAGVQGFRPRTPKETLVNKYGDCKDKANLMVALLRELGIEARFALINRGSFTDINFPSWQFNHAICYVPGETPEQPGLWLDATDGVAPFGFIAPGNAGRPAFVIGKENAEFITVSGGTAQSAQMEDRWVLDPAGKRGTFSRNLAGMKEYAARLTYKSLGPQQRDLAIREAVSSMLPSADLSSIKLSGLDELGQPIQIEAEFDYDGQEIPALDDGLEAYLALPRRDRPMIVNEQQPFRYEQVVEGLGNTAASAGSSTSVGGFRFDRQDDAGKRRSVVESDGGETSVDNYAKLRAAYRTWKQR